MRLTPSRAAMAVAAVALCCGAPLAAAAATPGPYAGTSQANVIWRYGQLDPELQTGKVTFVVRRAAITAFKVRGQRAQCPGTASAPVVNVTIGRMKLTRAGTATGSVIHPSFGPITVTLRVRGSRATGRIAYPPSCRTVARLSAWRR